MKELEAKMARLSHEQREHARWVQQRDRDARRMNDLQDEIDRAKQVPPPSHTLTFRLRPTLWYRTGRGGPSPAHAPLARAPSAPAGPAPFEEDSSNI